jgi:hypothetical protein
MTAQHDIHSLRNAIIACFSLRVNQNAQILTGPTQFSDYRSNHSKPDDRDYSTG